MKLFKSLVIAFLAFGMMGSAFAVKCKVHNARGQVWYGTGPSRSVAIANAMGFCSGGSRYAANCVVDWCRGTGTGGPAPWQCNVGNARGQKWVGTGPTRSAALANAMGFCSGGSRYAANCYVKTCFRKW
jgi:hypothetical protein